MQQPTHMQNLTLELTDHAIRFINNSVAAGAPFFHLMAYVHVHTALFSSPMFTNVSRGGRFGDNLEELDWSVGQLLQTLTTLGIDRNTLVLFTSGVMPGLLRCGAFRYSQRPRPHLHTSQTTGRLPKKDGTSAAGLAGSRGRKDRRTKAGSACLEWRSGPVWSRPGL